MKRILILATGAILALLAPQVVQAQPIGIVVGSTPVVGGTNGNCLSISGGKVASSSCGGGSLTSPNFTTQWSLNNDARWAYEAASTIGLHTTASDAASTGQGLIENAYAYFTDASNYERWQTNVGYGGGNLIIRHQAIGSYNGNTRALIFAPSDVVEISGDGPGLIPKNDGSKSLGRPGGEGWKQLALAQTAEPATPTGAAKFVLYVDENDGKLKAKGASGTVTPLANP